MRTFLLFICLAFITACGADDAAPVGDDTASSTADSQGPSDDGATGPGTDTAADQDVTGPLEGDAPVAAEDTTAGQADGDDPQAPDEDTTTSDEDSQTSWEDTSETPDEDTTTPQPDEDTSGPGGPAPTTLCGVLCHKLAQDCGSYEPFSADEAGCLATCEELAAVSLDSLVGLACLSDACEPSMCEPGDTPWVIPTVCHTACDLLEGCDLLGLIEPEYPDMVDLCIIGCASGHVVAPEFMPAVAHCVAAGLDEGCDEDIVEECVPQDPGPGGPGGPGGPMPTCADLCDLAMNFKCPPWTDGPADWATHDSCIADCELFAASEQASGATFQGCVMAATCDELGHCTAPPSGVDPGCVKVCAEVFGQCGPGAMPSEEFCEDYCTGQLMIYGAKTTAEEASNCLSNTNVDCQQDAFSLAFDCVVDLEADCTIICDAMDACQGGQAQGCVEPCNAGQMTLFSGKTTSDIATCMTEAADDCTAVNNCLNGPKPPPCYTLCTSEQACEPNQVMCEAACDTKVADGQLADVACEYADKCQTPGLCENLGEDTAPSECLDACDAAGPATCAAYDGGCVAACHGLITGNAGSDPLLPYCVVPELGDTCSIDAAYWVCFQ